MRIQTEKQIQFKALLKQVGAMSECERAAKFEKLPYINVEGRAYSACNMMMLALQGGGTVFGGFKQWLSQGRCVKKGEKSMMILVPIAGKKKVDEAGIEAEMSMRFICGNIFDISQTAEIENEHPVAIVSSEIAEQFGMTTLPNVRVVEELELIA